MLQRLIHFKIQDSPNPIWIKRGEKNDYFENVIKTFMGRDALSALLYNVSKKSVLLPAYICKEVTSEFIKHGYNIHYYDINSDFTIDIELIKKRIIHENIDVFYYVTYFGFFSMYNTVATRIKNEIPNVLIIEDRAHYLSNQFNFKNCDAYVFSFRKTLPIVEGGGVATHINMELEYKYRLLMNILPFAMFIKKLLFGYSDKITRSSIIRDEVSKNVKPISFLSNRIIQQTNYEKESTLRRDLYSKWIEKLVRYGIEPLFLDIDKNDIPLGCPIRVNDAEKIQIELEKEGYYLKRHWPLSEALKSVAPTSFEMSTKIITLPIYDGITEKDQDRILKLINKTTNRLERR
jgi:dTDP-4-amino-4,6-dideoxygalactose transaminase